MDGAWGSYTILMVSAMDCEGNEEVRGRRTLSLYLNTFFFVIVKAESGR